MFLLLTCAILYIQNVLSYTLVELCNSQSDSSLFKACIINIWSHTGRGVWWHDCGWRNNTSASGWFFTNTPPPTCVARTTHWTPVTEKTFVYYSSVAHQVEPASPTFGGGEQGASKARDDPVLGHCCFLARQHLGVVATLEPACVSAINVTKKKKHYSLFYVSYISYSLHSVPICLRPWCVQGLLPTGLIIWFCIFNTCTVLFFYSYFIRSHVLSCFCFYYKSSCSTCCKYLFMSIKAVERTRAEIQ